MRMYITLEQLLALATFIVVLISCIFADKKK